MPTCRGERAVASVIVTRCLVGDSAVFDGELEHAARVELAHVGAVDLLPGGGRLGDGRGRALLLAPGDLVFGDQGIAAHGEVFAEIRPASTAVVVKGLLDPRWRVEIEADAVLPG